MFPVEEVIPAVRASLESNRSVVLRAPPGSGKTTCVPLALLEAGFLRGKKILMLEPRRLAARSAADYMSGKIGERTGETVGYAVRLERKVSARTRLEILTEGLLARRFLRDPELSDVGLVIFDEFHERSVQCDLGFAMAVDVRRALRPDLRILVMSATLDAGETASFLGDADVHSAEARVFPVETRHLQMESSMPIAAQTAGAVRRLVADTPGDMLCFLPGKGEILRCAAELSDLPGAAVMPLYGEMSRDEQDAVLRPRTDGRRKIILATSIAETSLTIDGVRTVVDSGLMRVSRFSPSSGMSRLETLRVTRDRADQRRGRAGRTAPGVCLRMWTAAQDRTLAAHMKPEILEADLAPVVLAAAEWGSARVDSMPWLTPPPSGAWENARALLRSLGAVDRDGRITAHGRRMALLGAHPRLANMILRAGRPDLAAIIEEGAPHGVVDIRDVRPGPRMRELARRWERDAAGNADSPGAALALAFPDRIARNRGNGTFLMTCGKGAAVDRKEPLSSQEYLVLCDLDDRGGDATVRLAAPIEEREIEDLFRGDITEESATFWDRREECVRAERCRMLGRMVMRSGGQADPDPAAIRRALFEGIRQKGVANLPCWTAGARNLQMRITFLHRVLGEGWPDLSDGAIADGLEHLLEGFIDGMSRWSHLERLDLVAVFDFALAGAGHDRRELDRLAPPRMEVPSGTRPAIHYDEAEPFVQVRLQECFGLRETPKVAGGKVPVVMKLLSPAQRPVQVTKDLASFWETGYQLVRKELRGRYPRHYWPEDPAVAVATHRVRPRKDELH